MEISATANIKGIRPKDMTAPERMTIFVPEGIDDCLEAEKRENKKDGGEFTQYVLHLQDADEAHRVLRFLFEADLAPLAKAYGGESATWGGNMVELRPIETKRDGKVFINAEIVPVEA